MPIRLIPGGVVVLVLAGVVPLAAHAQRPAPATAVPLVFDGVTVVDVEQGRLLPGQRVVIVGNRIQAVGNASGVKLPKDAQVVAAQGKYLIPGLWDMHAHADRQEEYSEWVSWLFIASGVTGVRVPGTSVPLATYGQIKREIAAGRRVGPRYFVSGPTVNSSNGCTRGEKSTRTLCVVAADVPHVVDSLKTAGADFIKSYGTPGDVFYALAREGRRVGIPIDGHRSPGLTPAAASDSGHRIVDHIDGVQGVCASSALSIGFTAGSNGLRELDTAATLEKCRTLAARYRRNGTWSELGPVGPYMGSWPTRMTDADIVARHAYLPRAVRPDSVPTPIIRQPIHPQAFTLIQQADLPIVQGSDVAVVSAERWRARNRSLFPWIIPAVPGFSLQDEVIITAEHGLTALRALQAATLYSAKALGVADSLGTVAVGKAADLVLLDADPLADIYNLRKIRAVLANGRYFDRAALDAMLAQAGQAP